MLWEMLSALSFVSFCCSAVGVEAMTCHPTKHTILALFLCSDDGAPEGPHLHKSRNNGIKTLYQHPCVLSRVSFCLSRFGMTEATFCQRSAGSITNERHMPL